MPALSPRTVAEAVDAMADHPHHTLVAGGTDLMVEVNEGRRSPSGWIDTRSIDGIGSLDATPTGVTLGAGVTWATVGAMTTALPALATAAATVGGPQIRNRATLGGNVVTASPAGDSLPALLCHDAEVEIASPTGGRTMALAEFLVGPKRCDLHPGELLVAIHLPLVSGAEAFVKLGPRPAMAIAAVSVSGRLDPDRGVARLAVGAVAPTARRATVAEEAMLAGAPPEEVARAAADAAAPVDDHRATAAYRRHALEVLARRVTAGLYAEVGW